MLAQSNAEISLSIRLREPTVFRSINKTVLHVTDVLNGASPANLGIRQPASVS